MALLQNKCPIFILVSSPHSPPSRLNFTPISVSSSDPSTFRPMRSSSSTVPRKTISMSGTNASRHVSPLPQPEQKLRNPPSLDWYSLYVAALEMSLSWCGLSSRSWLISEPLNLRQMLHWQEHVWRTG